MCWNPDISINTFLFACFALVFIFIANTYTKYKSSTFKNRLVYLLFFEVALIQLIEFFLWRNLKNKSLNTNLSILVSYVIIVQIATLILMVHNKIAKYTLLIILVIG